MVNIRGTSDGVQAPGDGLILSRQDEPNSVTQPFYYITTITTYIMAKMKQLTVLSYKSLPIRKMQLDDI